MRAIKNQAENFLWWFIYRLVPKHRYHLVRTGFKPGYYDLDERLLSAGMSLVGEYVESRYGSLEK